MFNQDRIEHGCTGWDGRISDESMKLEGVLGSDGKQIREKILEPRLD